MDKRKAVTRSPNCKLREEAEIEDVLQKLQKLSKLVWTNAADSHSGVEDAIAREGTELEAVLKELEIRRFKRVASKDDKFARALRGVQFGFYDKSIELEKKISQLEGEKNQLEENMTREREAIQLELEKEREAAALKLKEVRAESVAEAGRLVTASATSRNNLAGKLY
ncbi:hypothetical protein GIB67_020208 [Kingdonia uniflora]|uniref:Uncharacterized protein n=1 Tax=Kingdonia uniflora TaxID=39325 RepID=A0A7J7L095_9MAGN|nr:hypothetical protein GIB67_020208 [Kingdonia uniflora]